MSILVPAAHVSGPVESANHDRRTGDRCAALEDMIERLASQQAEDRIPYWAAYVDERGVSHFASTQEPAYALKSPENAASRASATIAFGRAIKRYRATLAEIRAADPRATAQ